jgi:hypothetical protein
MWGGHSMFCISLVLAECGSQSEAAVYLFIIKLHIYNKGLHAYHNIYRLMEDRLLFLMSRV